MIFLVGDLMLDQTYLTHVHRISPEAPVPVALFQEEFLELGGAGNVASGIKSLGGELRLFCSIGRDHYGYAAEQLLKDQKIEALLYLTEKTTRKLRVKANLQQIVRIDFDAKINLTEEFISKITDSFYKEQVVVLSDYQKGMLDHSLAFIQKANELNCKVLIDPKSDDFKNYQGAWLIKPNLKEFFAAVGPCNDQSEIALRAKQIINKFNIENILITCGSNGMFLVNRDGFKKYPARSVEVFDVTGAGDTVIAALATFLDQGKSLDEAIHIAIDAASFAVSKNGTYSVTLKDIEAIRNSYTTSNKEDIKTRGKKIVFTNGCFDILHAGHIQLLEKAKSFGTHLIVGLNSNESVSRLKGPGRPINDQEHRRKILSSLRCVDEVIIFGEDTPFDLINQIKPDVLVKGSDYKISDIVGADIVLQNGGSVQTVDFIEDTSTTKIVDRVKNAK